MTFPGSIKGGKNGCSFSLHIFFKQDGLILFFSLTPAADHPSPWGEHIQFMDRCFLGNHSIIICSSLLDQWILEVSNWMFNSFSDTSDSILSLTSASLSFYYLHNSLHKEISSQADIKDLKLKWYSRRLICFPLSFNITKATGLINLNCHFS